MINPNSKMGFRHFFPINSGIVMPEYQFAHKDLEFCLPLSHVTGFNTTSEIKAPWDLARKEVPFIFGTTNIDFFYEGIGPGMDVQAAMGYSDDSQSFDVTDKQWFTVLAVTQQISSAPNAEDNYFCKSSTDQGREWEIGFVNGHPIIRTTSGISSSSGSIDLRDDVPHVVVTEWDDTNNSAYFYVDGEQVHSDTTGLGVTGGTSSNVSVGASWGSTNKTSTARSFNGTLGLICAWLSDERFADGAIRMLSLNPFGLVTPSYTPLLKNASAGAFTPWPGKLQVDTLAPIEIRIRAAGGISGADISEYKVKFDRPDIVEYQQDVSIGASGTTISLNENFSKVEQVLVTLQDTGSGVVRTVTVDKEPTSTAGEDPKIFIYNGTGTGVTGTVDVEIRGY